MVVRHPCRVVNNVPLRNVAGHEEVADNPSCLAYFGHGMNTDKVTIKQNYATLLRFV